VAGASDVTLLAMGVGGLVLFGPFGQILVRILFGRPDLAHWLILTLASFLVISRVSRRASRRLVIYRVEADALESALRDVLEPAGFLRTLDGYEDRTRARGFRVELSSRWQWAVIEATGRDPDSLIREFEPSLRERLRAVPARSTDVAVFFFGLSALTLLIPLTGFLLTQPRARAAFRALLERLQGG
jgi:predicted LPLAT superfamily acyltransferase